MTPACGGNAIIPICPQPTILMVTWDAIDTVLLDMDGTLLDLCYDNALWSTLLPTRYSEAQGVTLAQAQQHLFSHMQEHRGKLQFYCLDYWATFTGLDIIALHHELAELIAYRPNVPEFLGWLGTSGKRSLPDARVLHC